MKFGIIFLTILLGAIADSGVVSRYWLPESLRPYFINPKFKAGQCIKSPKRWGNRVKLVINFKDTKKKSGYLLKDQDQYEHFQYVSQIEVEKFAQVTSCRTQ